MAEIYSTLDRASRGCKYWWFDAWDWLINQFLKSVGAPRIITKPGELAIDPHIHTLYSHCSISKPEQIIRRAVKLGMDAVVIMDHDDVSGACDAIRCAEHLKHKGIIPVDFFIIPGTEINSANGHIGAIFVRENLPSALSPAETVRIIHEAGGLAIAVHPYHSTGIGDAIYDAPFDAIEVECGSVFNEKLAKRNADLVSDPRLENMAKFGSSDAHYVQAIGSCYTVLTAHQPTLEAARQAIIDGKSTAKISASCIRIRRFLGRLRKLK